MLGAISNSVPIALGLLTLGLWRKWTWVWALGAALLIHAALDFPLHADDAHRHVWPLSDWRWASPISYWDRDHHGWLGAILEIGVGAASIVVLWRRFSARWVKGVLLMMTVLYIAYAAIYLIGIA